MMSVNVEQYAINSLNQPNPLLILIATVIFPLQALLPTATTDETFNSIFFGFLLILVSWYGLKGQLLYIFLFFTIDFLILHNLTLLPLLGVYGIVIQWIQQEKLIWGITTLISFEVLRGYPFSSPREVYILCVCVTITIGLGMIFRNMQLQIFKSVFEAGKAIQEKNQIAVEVKHQIADLLHSTVARDLARIFILAEKGLVSSVNLNDISVISESAKNSSTLIRNILADLDYVSENNNLSEVIDSMRSLLGTQQISLHIEGPNRPFLFSPPKVTHAFSKFITEVAENIFKYGKPGSNVELSIVIQHEKVEISIINHKADLTSSFVPSSKIGLKNCAQLFSALGGEVSWYERNSIWITTAFLPVAKHKLETESEQGVHNVFSNQNHVD